MVLRLLVETYLDRFLSRPDSILEPFWLPKWLGRNEENGLGSVPDPNFESNGHQDLTWNHFGTILEGFWEPSGTILGVEQIRVEPT